MEPRSSCYVHRIPNRINRMTKAIQGHTRLLGWCMIHTAATKNTHQRGGDLTRAIETFLAMPLLGCHEEKTPTDVKTLNHSQTNGMFGCQESSYMCTWDDGWSVCEKPCANIKLASKWPCGPAKSMSSDHLHKPTNHPGPSCSPRKGVQGLSKYNHFTVLSPVALVVSWAIIGKDRKTRALSATVGTVHMVVH